MRPGRPPRILFVAMQNSPHVAKWIELIAGNGWDLHVFPLYGWGYSPLLRAVTVHWPLRAGEGPDEASLPLATDGTIGRLPAKFFAVTDAEIGDPDPAAWIRLGESESTMPALYGPGVLAALVRRLRPDLVHSMEFQHCGYLALRAKELHGPGFPPWIASNWGSDIYYFRHLPEHRAQITRLLRSIDFYACECHRDIALARELGLAAPALPVVPAAGGFDLAGLSRLRSPLPPSRRKLIMLKGYQHFAGRALTALSVLEGIADRLKGYTIVLYAVSDETRQAAQALIDRGVLDIRMLGYVSYDEIIAGFGGARLYIGISISDAISTSALEAMAMGAFPIQTNTSCCDEWFEHGVGGFLVPPDDPGAIRDSIVRALTDDALVDAAAERNARIVADRLDRGRLQAAARAFYDQPLAISRPRWPRRLAKGLRGGWRALSGQSRGA